MKSLVISYDYHTLTNLGVCDTRQTGTRCRRNRSLQICLSLPSRWESYDMTNLKFFLTILYNLIKPVWMLLSKIARNYFLTLPPSAGFPSASFSLQRFSVLWFFDRELSVVLLPVSVRQPSTATRIENALMNNLRTRYKLCASNSSRTFAEWHPRPLSYIGFWICRQRFAIEPSTPLRPKVIILSARSLDTI